MATHRVGVHAHLELVVPMCHFSRSDVNQLWQNPWACICVSWGIIRYVVCLGLWHVYKHDLSWLRHKRGIWAVWHCAAVSECPGQKNNHILLANLTITLLNLGMRGAWYLDLFQNCQIHIWSLNFPFVFSCSYKPHALLRGVLFWFLGFVFGFKGMILSQNLLFSYSHNTGCILIIF